MTKLEAVRQDLMNNPSAMALWQLAMMSYLRAKGYEAFQATISVGPGCDIVMQVTPELSRVQQEDIMTQLKTLKGVKTSKPDGQPIQYEFIY